MLSSFCFEITKVRFQAVAFPLSLRDAGSEKAISLQVSCVFRGVMTLIQGQGDSSIAQDAAACQVKHGQLLTRKTMASYSLFSLKISHWNVKVSSYAFP